MDETTQSKRWLRVGRFGWVEQNLDKRAHDSVEGELAGFLSKD